MFARRHQLVFLFFLALNVQRAWAFFDSPYLTPNNPASGDIVSVNIQGGDCDAIVGMEGYPQITLQGNLIDVVFFSVHYDDPEFCNLGVGTAITPIGVYPPGEYTVRVERRYMTVFATWERETLGLIPLTVSAVPSQRPIETPALSVCGLAVLLIALIVIVLRNLRHHLT